MKRFLRLLLACLVVVALAAVMVTAIGDVGDGYRKQQLLDQLEPQP